MMTSPKSLVDVSSCVFGDGIVSNENIDDSSPPNTCPRDVDILGQDEESMNEFIHNSLHKLENNIAFYPSMQWPNYPYQQPTPPTIPPLEMFSLLHPKSDLQGLTQPICMDSPINNNHKERTSTNPSSYEHKVTNTPINVEQNYGQGFKILRKQGCDIEDEHEIHPLLEQTPLEEPKGIGYKGPSPLHQTFVQPTKKYKVHGTIKKLHFLHLISKTK